LVSFIAPEILSLWKAKEKKIYIFVKYFYFVRIKYLSLLNIKIFLTHLGKISLIVFTKVWTERLIDFGNGGYGEPRFAIPMYI
jgi:hypothetical protein